MGEEHSSKWEGKTILEMKTITPQQIWPLLEDFCSLHKLLPILEKCYLVEGVPNKPGVIRCCESSSFSGEGVKYAKERLIMIDPSKMSLSYEVLDNNAGFKSYVATMELFPMDGDDGKCGCKFVWTFVSDPIEGFTKDGFIEVFKSVAQAMAKRMEETFPPSY